MLLRKTFRFEASHMLPQHPGKCARLHGHSWVLHVETEGKVNPKTGFVMDYADMSAAIKPLIERLDHRHLGAWTQLFYKPMNEKYKDMMVEGMPDDFYPSSENLCFWIAKQLSMKQFRWSKVALEETCTSYCEVKLDEFMVYFTNEYGLPAAQFALAEWK